MIIVLFATIAILTAVSPDFINTLQTKQSTNYAFRGIRSGLITGVTLVLTIREAFEDTDVESLYPHAHIVFDKTSGSAYVELEQGRERSSTEAGGGAEAESAPD